MTIQDWLGQASDKLAQADITSAKLDAELILAHVLEKPREYLLAHSDIELQDANIKAADRLVQKRAQRHPLVHLTGNREFYGLELKITPDVLTPRVETEAMVEQVITKAPKGGLLLDVGTGSGAIAIAIAKPRPDLKITASDVSPAALEVARSNAQAHGVLIAFIESDLLDQVTGRFDVITANLPYLPDMAELMPEVQKEPRVALLGGADGLSLYRRLFSQLSDYIQPNGLVLIEADPWQHVELSKIAHQADFATDSDNYFIMSFRKSQ